MVKENGGHKWLECIPSTGGGGKSGTDTTHHNMHMASKTVFANKHTLRDRNFGLEVRSGLFACCPFGSGHRTTLTSNLYFYDLDIVFSKMVAWRSGHHISFERALGQDILHWIFAAQVENSVRLAMRDTLPPNRQVKRMVWEPDWRSAGYPGPDWTTKLVA